MKKIVEDDKFYKKHEGDKIWWVNNDLIGVMEFTFDKKHIYNLFRDYPHNMKKREVEIFDKENPYWANFFRSRKTNAR